MLDQVMKLSRVKFRLLIALLATVLFLIVILTTYSIHNKAVSAVREESRQEEFTMARAGAVIIEKFISAVFTQLGNLEQFSEIQNCTNVENSEAFKAVYGMLRDHVESVSFFDGTGNLVAGYRGDLEPLEDEYFEVFREVLYNDIERRQGQVSKLQLGHNGENVILLSRPVYSTGQDNQRAYSGMLVAEMKPEKLIEILTGPLSAGKETNFAVIEPGGVVIASSGNPGMAGDNVFDKNGNCGECHKDISVIKDIIRSGGGSEVVEVHQSGKDLAAYVRISEKDPGWLVGVHSDYREMPASVRAIWWYAVLITLVGVVILLPGTLLLFMVNRKREETEERARYLEKEKTLLEKIREAGKEIKEYNQDLYVLNELASDVNKTLVLQDVLGVSLNKTLEITPFETGGIYLSEGEDNLLDLREHKGLTEDSLKAVRWISVGQSVAGRVAETGDPVFMGSMVSGPRDETDLLEEDEHLSCAGIPLKHGTTLVGVMSLVGKKTFQLSERKQRWLTSIGNIIGMAIGNCLLYQEVRTKAEEMSILYDVGRELTSTIELPKLGEILINTLKNRLNYPACTLLLPDRAREDMYVYATTYCMDGDFIKRRFLIGKNGVTGWVAQAKERLYVPDVTFDERYIKGREETRAELSIPLVFGDELLGILDFEKDRKDSFSEDEIRFLSLFANQLSVALYNVKMFEDTLQMNEELNRASEMTSEFISHVSHELRTPLTAIKSSIDIILLKMNETLNENVRYFLGIAKANVDRLSNMIDNLLDISRIESGRMQFSLKSLDINDPAKKAILNVFPLASQKEQQLQDEIVEDLPKVMADSSKVEQVFTNLIGNAIKYTPKGGTIRVLAERKNVNELSNEARKKISNGHSRFVQVTIKDTGPGIPEQEHEEIFKRFKRVEKGGGKGTGLGLAISKYLVEAHGGGVWVESEPGRGSSFKFLIPLFEGEHSES